MTRPTIYTTFYVDNRQVSYVIVARNNREYFENVEENTALLVIRLFIHRQKNFCFTVQVCRNLQKIIFVTHNILADFVRDCIFCRFWLANVEQRTKVV